MLVSIGDDEFVFAVVTAAAVFAGGDGAKADYGAFEAAGGFQSAAAFEQGVGEVEDFVGRVGGTEGDGLGEAEGYIEGGGVGAVDAEDDDAARVDGDGGEGYGVIEELAGACGAEVGFEGGVGEGEVELVAFGVGYGFAGVEGDGVVAAGGVETFFDGVREGVDVVGAVRGASADGLGGGAEGGAVGVDIPEDAAFEAGFVHFAVEGEREFEGDFVAIPAEVTIESIGVAVGVGVDGFKGLCG